MFRQLNNFRALLPHYVETHYRYAGFPSLFGKKAPHILFDMPRRLEPGQDLPVYCIIKDADHYPLQILSFEVKTQGGKTLYSESCNFSVNTFIFHHLCCIPRQKLEAYKGFPLHLIPEVRVEQRESQDRPHPQLPAAVAHTSESLYRRQQASGKPPLPLGRPAYAFHLHPQPDGIRCAAGRHCRNEPGLRRERGSDHGPFL
ncbi:MAG: hypothetical protein U5N26_06545 [Candidatus Marinimicrobia bacterium]|nr:hypothetical protein [Candidatus Neomarinimicrobiota bacterium]